MSEHQIRGIIAVCVVLTMIPLILFITSLPIKSEAPILSTSDLRTLAVEVETSAGSGIYFVEPDSTTKQLLPRIGLPANINDDMKIRTGTRIRLNHEGRIVTEKMEASKRLALGLPLDVNHARVHELALIPGVGDKMAARIVEYREKTGPLKSINQLKEIRGIKDKKLSRLTPYLYVDHEVQ